MERKWVHFLFALSGMLYLAIKTAEWIWSYQAAEVCIPSLHPTAGVIFVAWRSEDIPWKVAELFSPGLRGKP